MPFAPFYILPTMHPLVDGVKWRSPSVASLLDGAFVVRAFCDVSHKCRGRLHPSRPHSVVKRKRWVTAVSFHIPVLVATATRNFMGCAGFPVTAHRGLSPSMSVSICPVWDSNPHLPATSKGVSHSQRKADIHFVRLSRHPAYANRTKVKKHGRDRKASPSGR